MHQFFRLRGGLGDSLDVKYGDVKFIHVSPPPLAFGQDVDLSILDRPPFPHLDERRFGRVAESTVRASEEGELRRVHA